MIDAVIFDMDGLIIDSEPIWRSAEQAAFQTVGITLDDSDMSRTMGLRVDEVVAFWHHERPWKVKSQKDLEAIIADEVIRQIRENGKAMPGVHTALSLIRKHKIPIAVASSSSDEIIAAVLEKLQIREYFKVVVSAEHESHGKPHPGVYITAATKLGVSPARCLAFEDSPNGVLSAKAAQMKCVAIPDSDHRNHPYIAIADTTLDNLGEFNIKILTQ